MSFLKGLEIQICHSFRNRSAMSSKCSRRTCSQVSFQYLPDQMQFEWKKWELAEQTGQYWALAPGFHPGFWVLVYLHGRPRAKLCAVHSLYQLMINKAMFGNLITKSRHAQNMSDCCPVCFWAFWLLFLFRSFRCGSAVIVSSCTLLSIIIVTLGFLMSSHAERPLETDAWARPS